MYAELHCKTNFSFLEGASHADELVLRAAELGYRALAITDKNSLAGIVRAHGPAKEKGLKLLIGAEMTPIDAPPVVLWAPTRAAYGRLCRLITAGRMRAEKGECRVTLADIAEHAEGLIAGVVPSGEWGVGSGEREMANLKSEISNPHVPFHHYRDLFPGRSYLLASLPLGPDDRGRLAALQKLARETGLPIVAAGDVHYHVPGRSVLHGVLTATRHGITVDEANRRRLLFPNAQRHLRTVEEIEHLFADVPDALRRTIEIADRCTFSLDELKYEYPEELAPPGKTPLQHLIELTWQGAKERYPAGIPDKVSDLLRHELTLIADVQYEAFFLTVWDLVRFARGCGILCQGRGSAANSAVCYCLGVTSVDPATTDVLFERFISRERNEAPDIDVDFEHERREEVLQYLYNKYGRERAGLAAVVISYRTKSAIRDVGKALGLSLDRVDALAKHVEGYSHDPLFAQRCREVGVDPESEIGRRLIHLVGEILGFPRHLSQHVGGMVMTRGPLCELVPIENAAMEGRTVIQWDKDDLDELGILKVDCLSLGMLTAIRKCFELIERHHGHQLTLANIPQDDEQVYDMICRADTIGVFQIESRAQMSMLPRLRPRTYYDLVIEVAIVRPGPIQGNMVHPYLQRRTARREAQERGEKWSEEGIYPSEAIREVLAKTEGVPIFQEQAMRLAVVAAGFTPSEADQLRRAMAAWRRPGIIDQFHKKLIDGMRAKGLSEEFAEQVFNQIRGFGEYGFPESHAASFALLVYVSAWLKHHYPAAFAAAIINSQPMGFYAPAQLVRDARQHGVEVRPVEVNASEWDCTLEGKSLRLGLRMLSGLSELDARRIMLARQDGPFTSPADLAERTQVGRAVLMRLAEADALRSLAGDRRAALWTALGEERSPRELPLFANVAAEREELPPGLLPALSEPQEVAADYQTLGLTLRAHPMSFHRAALDRLGIVTAAKLAGVANNRYVRVAGLVILRQRPSTAKEITFVTLEDETGTINLVVKPKVWQQHYQIARRSNAWIAHGKLEERSGVIHVVVRTLTDFSAELADLRLESRDFH